ncbi:hypothetical protein, partial [Pseudomonas sp. 71_D]|uniref:hypothetical protein n=1 Tax=Pseudomonas sp. 71_D TaxID=2813564 RepID=UPI001A9D2CF7
LPKGQKIKSRSKAKARSRARSKDRSLRRLLQLDRVLPQDQVGLWADRALEVLGVYPFLRVLRLAVPLLQRVTFADAQK